MGGTNKIGSNHWGHLLSIYKLPRSRFYVGNIVAVDFMKHGESLFFQTHCKVSLAEG